jgi:exodeoxyribonuclease VII large subunit
VDYSLCDYVADHRSETPTAAAETLSQPQTELASRIQYCHSHLKGNLFKAYQEVQLLIHKFHPLEMLNMMKQKVQNAEKRLLAFNLMERAPELIGHQEASQKLDEYVMRLNHSTQLHTQSVREKLKRFEQVLSALNPKKVLERGYSYAEIQSGEVITSLKQFKKLNPHEKLKLTFHDGVGTVTKES